jgi:hypothetical protein
MNAASVAVTNATATCASVGANSKAAFPPASKEDATMAYGAVVRNAAGGRFLQRQGIPMAAPSW